MSKRNNVLSLIGLMLVSPLMAQPAHAGQAVSVKMGYFNLNQVKAAHPASAGLDRLENNAKELLKIDADKANAELTQMQKSSKSTEEIEAKKKELQLQLNAKVDASMNLLMGNRMAANSELAQLVNSVAKEKGLDLVVDANGIFSGGEKFAASGEDITDAILQRLTPSYKPDKPADKPAK